MCYRDCAGNGDCRGDQFCGNKICVPRCRPGDCQPSYRCDAQSGRCVYSPEVCMPSEEVCNEIDDDCDDITDEGCSLSTVLPEGVGRIDLGTVGVGGGGVSRDISFHIPQTVGSFTLVALTGDASYIGLWSLSAPDGTALVDATDPFSSPNPVIPQEGALTALVSNAPARFTVIPGTYRATLLKDGDWMRVPVSVLTRAHDQGGRLVLDVNYYFVGTPGITASNYQSNSKFGSVLSTFWQVMKRADIYPGIVQAFDITGSDAQKYTYLDMSLTGKGELPELLALSGRNPNNGGLNYFFVQDIANYGALGVAGGIPGPPIFQGTASSGVAVSMASYYHYTGSYAQYGVADTAEAMAHETGHYMGLFHLSEKDGNTHDPLTDTPECSNDANGDGMVGPDECVGRGAENLMFWSVTGAVAISGQQRQVIRGFPQNHP